MTLTRSTLPIYASRLGCDDVPAQIYNCETARLELVFDPDGLFRPHKAHFTVYELEHGGFTPGTKFLDRWTKKEITIGKRGKAKICNSKGVVSFCVVCGAPIVSTSGKPKKYCSRNCNSAAGRKKSHHKAGAE